MSKSPSSIEAMSRDSLMQSELRHAIMPDIENDKGVA
jgi:hypothetical protein